MKKFITLVFLAFFLTACSENFEIKDPAEFNQKINNQVDIKTPIQLIKNYYDYPIDENDPNISISTENLGNDISKIIFIQDRLEDDSLKAIKMIMTAQLKNKQWKVLEIKSNWKCWEGRGHTNWDIQWCN